MKRSSLLTRVFAGLIALSCALASTAFGQGVTTSAITGFVTDKQGNPISGATVTIVHEPTGTKVNTTTRTSGQYDLSGLRVGGPYTVSATSAGAQIATQPNIYLDLGQTQTVNLGGGGEVVKLEAFTVAGARDTTFGANKMGTGSSFSEERIRNIATVRDNVQDIARLDSRITLNSLDQGGQLSAQGQNFRFNSFLVDGVESNDPFGLKGDGTNALRSPVALESLQAIEVQLTPFDVRRSGATGVYINTITKSGTNEFHGSAAYEYSDKSLRAKNPNPASTLYNTREAYKERTWNFGLGGPIIPNRLFFYVNSDDYRRDAAPPSTNFKYTDQTQIDTIIARAKALGYDPGSLGGVSSTVSTQKTKMAKVDWNITDEHRLTVTYRDNDGTTPIFPSLTSVFGQSFSNYWYDTPSKTTVYTGVLNSQWSPDLHTEATLTYTKFDGSPKNRGTPFPEVTINGLTGVRGDTGATITTGSVRLGTEFSRQLNILKTKEWQGKLNADYSWGNHTFTVGGEADQIKYYNAFAQALYGSYTFTNPTTWQAGTPSVYTDAKLNPGFVLDDAIAKWKYEGLAAFVQDTWKPNQNLTLLAGLRLDYPYVPQSPPVATGFATAFGFANNTTNDGNWTLAPRVGFNYRVPAIRRTEIRGGIGLFQGRNPAVWISNAYSQAGQLGTVSVNNPAITFEPDVTKQPAVAGSLPAPNINITDPKFRQPAVWKANLAFDHQLPFLGLVFTAELDAIQTYKALAIQFLNYQVANDGGPANMPDGRIRYAGNITPNYSTAATPNNTTTFPQTSIVGRRRVTTGGPTGGGFADVYLLTNTSKGEQHGLTLSLNRPLKNHWGAGLAWTRSHATEVAPMTSSTAGSLYGLRAVYNPNEDVASTSNTDTKDKLVANFSTEWTFIRNAKTRLDLTYIGQTGHAFSWVFKGDANGDGFTDNDLFYMPTGPNDPKVRWNSTAERDQFFADAAANGLSKYSGTVVPRNAATSPWNNTLDLSITQDIPGAWRLKPQLVLQCVNFGNLLNSKWGLLEEVPFSYKRTAAGAILDKTANNGAGQYVYLYNQNTIGQGATITTLDPLQSRWQLKVALKLSF